MMCVSARQYLNADAGLGLGGLLLRALGLLLRSGPAEGSA